MPLEEYRRKRHFEKTPEPAGSGAAETPPEPFGAAGKPPEASGHRFVVQKHKATRLHYDFRLELDGVLKSWAVPKGPTLDPATKRLAMLVEDHPVEYFDFEGTIPKGEYGGGTVMVWDWGKWTPETKDGTPGTWDDARRGFEKGDLKFRLEGERLAGRFALVRTRGGEENAWLLIKKQDDAADPHFDPDALATSVKTGRTMEQIATGAGPVWDSGKAAAEAQIDLSAARTAPFPDFIPPMQAMTADKPFSNPDWLFEIKWDGWRLITLVRDDRVRAYTRNQQSADHLIRGLLSPSALHAREAVLDGEVVALDEEGRPSFELLQRRLGMDAPGVSTEEARSAPLVYYVFDILYFDGRELLKVPLIERKRLLGSVVIPGPGLRLSEHVEGEGEALFRVAQERNLEGLVAKRRNSLYAAGKRSPDWLKLKTHNSLSAVIVGWTEGKGSREDLGALAVGLYDGKKLVGAGQVGSGFSAATIRELMMELKPLERASSPLRGGTPASGTVHWVEPKLVAEIEYREWTRAGVLRHPVFQALRGDIAPQDCRADQRGTVEPPDSAEEPPKRGRSRKQAPAEATPGPPHGGPLEASAEELAALEAMKKGGVWEVAGRRVELSNLDKVIFPGKPERDEPRRTKRDLIRYYVTAAPVQLPHLRDRGVTLHRFPDGVDKPGFWQKQAPEWMPDWIRRWRPGPPLSDEPRDYIVVEEVATLAWLGNHAAIDLHPWSSRISDPEHPTWALFDLDPGDSSFELALKVLRMVKEALDHLGLQGCPKVSGQRGLQVYVPIKPRYSYDDVRTFVRKVAEVIGRLLPEEIDFTWEVRRRRPGTLRIDYTQMAPNKTLAAPYSVRPRPEATVSMPIAWSEIDDPNLRSDRWTIATAPQRIASKGDLFAPLLSLEQELPDI